ncbi:uncharacterized protein [Henckelia pumila]|uniref:uncharacterized protein n=1 Tax=Henckelia pumila TaxID=405737 RepID=UPI003C6E2216
MCRILEGHKDTFTHIKHKKKARGLSAWKRGGIIGVAALTGETFMAITGVGRACRYIQSAAAVPRRKRMHRKPGECYFCSHCVFVCLCICGFVMHSVHCSEALRTMFWISMGWGG